MEKPPPLPQRRRHPRIEIYAQAQVKAEGEVYVLPALNASSGGLFLEGSPTDHPDLTIGSTVEIELFVAGEEEAEPVRIKARVARVQAAVGDGARAAGFGLAIEDIGGADRGRYEKMLARSAASF
jgi:hypothetical protein